jgi:hypothetical protein
MTSNRPLEDWGKLIGDVPAPRRFSIASCITPKCWRFQGKSYRLRTQHGAASEAEAPKPANAPTGSVEQATTKQIALP